MRVFYVVFGLVFLFSCKKSLKNIEDYFPKVEIKAEKQTDGTVKLTGIILEQGGDDINELGFCYAQTPDFSITSNQELATDVAQFQTTMQGPFDPTKTYYFKAFASNRYGRAESIAVPISEIESVPIIAPCSQTINTYSVGVQNGGLTSFNEPIYGFNKVTYPGSGNFLIFLNVTFKTPPLTGLFTTVFTEPDNGEVNITLNNGSGTTVVNPGATVYVNRLSETQFKVEICSSTVTINGTNYNFKTHLVRNY